MNFLQQLNEAANIPLDELKKKMQKDPRVKMVFQRGLKVDELKDPVEFAKTIHFYLFNNPQVRAYIQKRGDRRDVTKGWASKIANLVNPTKKFSQFDLDWLVMFVKELFRDLAYVQKQDISKRGFEGLMAFYDGSRNTLDAYSAREIDSLGFKPSGPITLYKGLLFDEKSFKSENYFGYGEGLKFLKSIREGKRTVDLNYEDYTIWTTDKDLALLQALYGSESSWRKKEDAKEGKIGRHKGKLAFVISTLASPDDIVVEMSKFSEKYGHPTPSQTGYHSVVIKPGKRLARVVSKHTPEGEEDPISQDETHDLADIQQLLTMFGRILKLPVTNLKYEDMSRFTHDHEAMRQLAVLNDPNVKEKVGKLLNSAVSFYQKHLKDIDLTEVSNQVGKHSSTFTALQKIHDVFKTSILHKDYADPNSSRKLEREHGSVYIRDLKSGDQILSAGFVDTKAEDAARVIASQKRWTEWRINGVWRGLAEIGNPSLSWKDKLHLEGWKVQKPFVDAAMDGFYKVMGMPKPESHTEQAKDFLKATVTAQRVARGLNFLQRIQDASLLAGQ